MLMLMLAMIEGRDLQGAATDGATSQITPKILQILRRSGFAAVVPTYLPPGFRCGNVSLDEGEEGFDLQMVWLREEDQATIALQMAWEGLGDYLPGDEGVTEKEVATDFGEVVLYGSEVEGVYEWGHNWVEVPETARGEVAQYFMLLGSGCPLDEAAKVLGSVKRLTPLP